MIYIKTISKPLAYKYELNLVKLLTDKGYYGDLKKSKRSIVNKIISKYNNSHFPHINFKQAMSIRSSYMREKIKKNNKVTQDQVKNIENSKLTFSEEDALRNQLFGCWNFPLSIPYDDNLIVKIIKFR